MNIPLKALGLFFVVTGLLNQASGDSYKVWVRGGTYMDLIGYNYAATNLNHAIPQIPDGATVWIWNVAEQKYDLSINYAGYGWDPDYLVHPGTAFFVTTLGQAGWLSIHGTPLTTTTHTVALETNKVYFLSSAYKLDLQGGNFLECMGSALPVYVHNSLRYEASVGDKVYQWDATQQDWYLITRTVDQNNYPKWDGLLELHVSPTVAQHNAGDEDPDTAYGGAFVLEPAEANTWVQLAPNQPHGCE